MKPTISNFKKLLKKHGLQARQQELLSLAADCFYFRSVGRDAGKAVGRARLGGMPDLPDGIAWPTFAKKHLTFLAQIRLEDLPEHDLDLPGEGMLYFFLGSNENAGNVQVKVIYIKKAEKLVAGRLPEKYRPMYEDEGYQYLESPQRVAFESGISIPENSDPLVSALKLTESENEAYYNLKVEWKQQISRSHKLLGHFQYGLHDPRQKGAAKGAKKIWRCLAEIRSDDRAGFCFWDRGKLILFIDESALVEENFSDVRAVIETL